MSANIRSGLVLGMPPFLLMIQMSAISPVKAPESCRCPAVVTRGMDAAPRSGEKIDTFAGQVFASLPRSDQRATGRLYLRG